MIYVARNPRDAVITYFNHFKVLEGYTGSFETFADAFLKDECGYYTPFMQNVRGFWEARQRPNIMFITYEEMKRDLPSVIRRVSDYLGRPVAEADMPALADFLSFDKMRNNPAMNKQDSVEVNIYTTRLRDSAWMQVHTTFGGPISTPRITYEFLHSDGK